MFQKIKNKNDHPKVHTTSNGSFYVDVNELIHSKAAKEEIKRLMKNINFFPKKIK